MLSVVMSRSGRHAAMSLVLVAALAVVVSACGSSSSSNSAVTGTPVASSTSAYQARLQFAKCMRAHGVNVPDPSPNGGPAAGAGGAGGGGGFRQLRNSPNYQSAFTACRKSLGRAGGFGNITSAQRAQFRADAVKFAECMRSHNIDIPDPGSNGAGGFGIFRSIPSSERQSPAFQSAIKACSSNLPRFGRGGPGGGGPPPGGAPGA
jgi:hypothetical protein